MCEHGTNLMARHTYSFLLVKSQRFDFVANHKTPQNLGTDISNNGFRLGLGSGPAFLGSRRLPCLPLPGTHSITARAPAR